MTGAQLIDRFVPAKARNDGFFDNKRILSMARLLNNPRNLPLEGPAWQSLPGAVPSRGIPKHGNGMLRHSGKN
jgi:hypothetical protein